MNLTALLQKAPVQTRLYIEFGLLFLAGAFITLALAPFKIWPLAIVSLVILYLAWVNTSAKQAIWRSWYFGSGLFFSGSYWVYVSIHDHGGASPFLAGIMTAGFNLFLASLLIPFAYYFHHFFQKTPKTTPLAFAAIWLLSEWLRTWLLTGFPWLFIGYSQLEGPLSAWAPIVGTLGISFMLAYTAAAFAQSVLTHKLNWHWLALLLIWLPPIYLATIEWTERKSDKAYSVALIQPNLNLEDKWDPDFREPIKDYYKQASFSLADQDLIIWPETAIPQTYHNALEYLEEIDKFAKKHDNAIILGIPSRWYNGSNAVYHNTMLAIGKADGIYHKQKLVPFGEFIPLENVLRGIITFFDLPMSYFRAGPANQPPLIAKDLTIMPYICYEVVYPEFVAATAGKVDLLLTVSNDAWFGESIGPIQHLQMAQMRALENGRYMLRDTNNGITAVINQKGVIITALPSFEVGILKAKVYAYKGLTPVAQYGTLPAVIFSFIILILLMFRSLFQRSSKNMNKP